MAEKVANGSTLTSAEKANLNPAQLQAINMAEATVSGTALGAGIGGTAVGGFALCLGTGGMRDDSLDTPRASAKLRRRG